MPLSGVTGVSVGQQSTCFSIQDGDLLCQGWPLEQSVSDGGGPDLWPLPRPLGIRGALAFDVGWGYACAVLRSREVSCRGYHSRYARTKDDGRDARIIGGIADAAQVALGSGHVCVLSRKGEVRCWGWNVHGEVGVDPSRGIDGPVRIEGLVDVVEIAAGSFHTCARERRGLVRCFGLNQHGQLGTGDTQSRLDPAPVKGIRDATQIVADGFHSCARLASGSVVCWGEEQKGEFGTVRRDLGEQEPAPRDHLVPSDVSALRGAAEIGLGEDFLCGRWAQGTLKCGGNNGLGQLGRETFPRKFGAFAPVATIADAALLSAAEHKACARSVSGVVRCWGTNVYDPSDPANPHSTGEAPALILTEP